MSRGQLVVLAVLVLVVLVYTGAIAVGRADRGGGSTQRGPQEALGDLLIRPASLSDLAPAVPSCAAGGRLVVPRGGACAYALRSGFFGKRLRLRLAAPGEVTAVLTQPKPEVTDTKRLDVTHDRLELTYKQDGSRLTLACTASPSPECRVEVTPGG